ncbi:MAG: PIG-L family deacetylase [Pyrinomonadaceae bacterium]|nr:PIG-L family deacetylase [Pyrinomonadaceae bacterium]MBP6212588.1 PIG-L family deacetylase [Pyrinomonadaceae bacterium]
MLQSKIKIRRLSVVALDLAVLVSIIVLSLPVRAQVRPVYDLGSSGLGQKLRRLQTTASAMHTAAHPDDEDSGLLARLARGDNARVSYLSLTRGEGGQNVIGSELFESLGIIRTEELLQARRLDGGEQFFTRFMEYGFSKQRTEAARIWGEKEVLGDMVRAIRLFRPLVVISRFSGTPADGHGQHQLAGYLTPIAFKAAADPKQFPEHFAEGLEPWQAKKLYVGQGFAPNAANPASLVVPTGEYDPLIGRSYYEIATEGRSQHKSQEMGSIEPRGKAQSGLRLLESSVNDVKSDKGVFDGIDTSIKGIASFASGSTDQFKATLSELQQTAETALREYDPYHPEKLIPILAKGMKLAEAAVGMNRDPEVKFLLRQKHKDFANALQAAAGIVVDALSDSETVVAGDTIGVAVRVFAPEVSGVKINDVAIKAPEGWTTSDAGEPAQDTSSPFRQRNEVALGSKFFKLTAAANASPTQPYWLENQRDKFTFNWSAAGQAANMPFQAALASAQVKMNVGGEELTVNVPVTYRYADQIRGEIRRDVNVVPMVTNALESSLAVIPTSAKAQQQKVVMSVTNNSPKGVSGTAKLDLPQGWTVNPASVDFAIKSKGAKTAVSFDVTIPANTKAGAYNILAKSVVGGKEYGQTVFEVAYPHIQTHRRYAPSVLEAKVVDLKVSPVNVGYVMGTGDRVPEAIKLLGLPVTMLSEKDLTTGDLSKFDTIVIGIRASQVRPDYTANNGRLLEFVKNGGTLIVQYQQSEFIRDNLVPFPAKMESVVNGTQRVSNVRVVDENAPVTMLVPDHVVFNFPNKIVSSDWDNWVQERNLYTLTGLDPQYTALLSSQDEGEAPVTGGLVYAKIGKGHYIYNAYSFFRQLPTGNPGAYRLFANMLSLPKSPAK